MTTPQQNESMKKLVFTYILLLYAVVNLSAQGQILPSYAVETNYYEGLLFGLKGGVNFPRLYYTNQYVSDLPHDFVMGFSVGAFVEIPFNEWLALAPELNYQQRGGATSYVYEQEYNVSYSLKANYASVRLPLIGYLRTSRSVRPYLLLGPDVGYVINGEISLSQPGLDIPDSHINLTKSNIDYWYVGMLGGVGVRANLVFREVVLVVKMDAAINFGFTDTFSDAEHNETATPTNVHAYNHQGKRLSRGLEINLSIGYIREKKDDVCGRFKTYRAKRAKD